MVKKISTIAYCCILLWMLHATITNAQSVQQRYWHGKERSMHYAPAGNNFVCVQPYKKFNRALYGGNTAFRVETGDLPEFALYMPGMGGNCNIGIVAKGKSKWLSACSKISTTYMPGKMQYIIQDELLGAASLQLEVLALNPMEGMVLALQTSNTADSIEIVVVYGGASGKKFSRDGDIGADPESSFYLQPAYCKDNIFRIAQHSFQLQYGFSSNLSEEQRYEIQYNKPVESEKGTAKTLQGVLPTNALLQIGNALQQQTPLQALQATSSKDVPVLVASFQLKGQAHIAVYKPSMQATATPDKLFAEAEIARQNIAAQITLHTPDPYLNPLGGALAMAADAIWEAPSYMHGAVAWRMRLPAWRGAYCADVLGWHNRARQHFSSYATSQTTVPNTLGVVADTALHLARQLEKMGTQMFSDGYICRNPNGDIRPHHYDMNLVFVDQLLHHFLWTGDTGYVRQMFPLLQKHLAWEKKNYDADGDGLYDAYACIWASDALQYSGGGVAHASAYNYRANAMVAQLAKLIGAPYANYEQEANKIQLALNQHLWLKNKGWLAEYKDLLGKQAVHESAGLWTLYHAAESGVLHPLQKAQMMQYVAAQIPHIPLKVKGYADTTGFLLSTTNWQPYTWSINNVVLAENIHTALAYWQSQQKQEAFQLFKSTLVESMYASAGPGNLEQLSFYDAIRGELYRDFADGVGITARTLVEGLFGIQPNVLQETLLIHPGFPTAWKFAQISIPDIQFNFQQTGNHAVYRIEQKFARLLHLSLQIEAQKTAVASIRVNGQAVSWHWVKDAMQAPEILIEAGKHASYTIEIFWEGASIETIALPKTCVLGEPSTLHVAPYTIVGIANPQQAFSFAKQPAGGQLKVVPTALGRHSFFVTLQKGDVQWIQPIHLQALPPILIQQQEAETGQLQLILINHSAKTQQGNLMVNHQFFKKLTLQPNDTVSITLPASIVYMGTNAIELRHHNTILATAKITDWSLAAATKTFTTISMAQQLNNRVSHIFKQQYLSPRAKTVTLQIPWQGIGNWCYPLTDAPIQDSALLQLKDKVYCQQIPFAVRNTSKNILFTSLWQQYPAQARFTITGKARHAYLLMAGSTNHQQSHFEQGKIIVVYTDGSKDSLILKNPTNWYPIEQDYYTDGFAFTTGESKPYRFFLKDARFSRTIPSYTVIKGFSNYAIDGGAATVLDMPLDPNKTIQQFILSTTANEVIIGMMAITLAN